MPRSSTAITSTPYSRHAPRPLPAPHPPPLPSARPLDGLMATLPGEIHILILAYLLDADPVTLTRVSRSLWKQAIPQVYSDIVIEARNCQQLFYGLGSPFGQGIQDVRDLKDSVTALRDPPGFGPLSQKELGARLFDMLIMEIVPRTGLVRKLASFRYLQTLTIMDESSDYAVYEAIKCTSGNPGALFCAAEGFLPTIISQVSLSTVFCGGRGFGWGSCDRTPKCDSLPPARQKRFVYLPADLSGHNLSIVYPDRYTPAFKPDSRQNAYQWVEKLLARHEYKELCVDQVWPWWDRVMDLKGITHLKKLVFIGRPPGKGLSDEEWTERVINRMWAMPDTSVWSWWLSLGGELRMMSRKASTWEAGRIEVSPASKTRSTTTRW